MTRAEFYAILRSLLEVNTPALETLNTYAHLWPDSEDRTRTAVDEVLGLVQARADRGRAVP